MAKEDGGVDKDLVAALKMAKTKRMFFALIIKGGTDGTLIVSRRKIPPKQVAEAKARLKSSAAVLGTCYGSEEGGLIFETPKVPVPAWAAVVKKVAKRDAGLTIAAQFRLGQDPDTMAEELGDEDLEAAAQKTALPPVPGQEPGATPSPPPPPPPLPPPDGARAGVLKRLNALADGVKAALKGPDASRIQALLGSANGLVKNKDYAQAARVLDELEPLVARGASATTPPPEKGADKETATARLKALRPDFDKALALARAADAERAGELDGVFAQLYEQIKGGRFAAALGTLDQLDGLVKAALKDFAAAPPPPPGTEKKTAPDGKAAKVLPLWTKAREIVGGQLSELQGVLRGTKNPDMRRIAEYGMNGITKRLQVGLQVALMNLDQAAGDARPKAADKVRQVVADYRKFLESDRLVPLLDKNPFGVKVAIRPTLGAVLTAIEKAVGK